MKRLKGMTLLEIVISIAIFALLSLLIVQVVSTTNTILRTATDLGERIYQEKVYVNTNKKEFMDDVRDYEPNEVSPALNLTVEFGDSELSPLVPVVEKVTKNDGSVEAVARDDRLNSNIHFRFLEFGSTAKVSAVTDFATGGFTLQASGSTVPEIKQITVSTPIGMKIYEPGSTTETNSYVLDASELPGGDGRFSDGEEIISVTMPDSTSEIKLEIVVEGLDDPITSTFTFQAYKEDALTGQYQSVGKSTIYIFNGKVFDYA